MCFKKELLNIQEKTVPKCGKTSCQGKRPAWLNRELKLEFRGENENISPLEGWSGNLGGLQGHHKVM